MGFRILNPVRDFSYREETQKKSISNRVNKDTLYLILLLIGVGGILLWQNYQLIEDKAGFVFSELKATVAQKPLFSEDSGLDVSEINLENLLPEGKEEPAFAEATAGKEEETQEQVIVSEPQLTLLEIQEEVNKVAIEVERIGREVQELKAFTELQKEINEITILIVNLNSKKK